MSTKIVVTVLGRDRPGIVASVSSLLAKFNANIVKARGASLLDLFLTVMAVDVSGINAPLDRLIGALKDEGLRCGLGVSVELGELYGKEKKLIAFDMDSTLLEAEAIDELAELAGVGEQVRAITKQAMEGDIDFKTALERRAALLRGLPAREVERLARTLPVAPGARDLVSELKKAGYVTVLLTSGFDIIAERIKEELGFDYAFANKLVVRDGVLTGEVQGVVLDAKSKLDLLRTVAEAEGVGLDECVAIGDGANDLLIIRDVGLGVGFNPKRVVREEADAVVNVRDLSVVLAFLGAGKIRESVAKRLAG